MSKQKNKFQSITDIIIIAVLTIMIGTLMIVACGANPLEAYQLFFKGIFGAKQSFLEVFVKACPLVLTGLGCAVAYQTGFFTIGAEGQFYIGAMAATAVVLNIQESVPGVVCILAAIFTGFIAGGLWALIAAVFKAKFNISEIIVTIMMNYIAINFLGYAVRGFLMDPEGHVPQSAKIAETVQLKSIISGSRFHAGIVIAILLVILVWFLMEKTTVGYELKAVGFNRRASTCNGISVMKNIILSAGLSGGLAGIAGVIELLSIQKRLLEGFSAGCGYTAVLVSLIAFNNPIGVFFVAVLYAAMQVGVGSMQRKLGVPSAIVDILIGVIVVLILARQIFHKIRIKKSQEV